MMGPEQPPSKMFEEVLSIVVQLVIFVVPIVFLFRRKQQEAESRDKAAWLKADPDVQIPITAEERQTLMEEYSSASEERLVMLLFEPGLRKDARFILEEEVKRRGIKFVVDT